jgi:hypothetical protein
MLGYDYEILYKKGRDNIVVNTLSRQYEDAGSLLTLSVPIPELLEVAHQQLFVDPDTTHLICWLQDDPEPPCEYSW